MYKPNFKKRVWIVKQHMKCIPTKELSAAQKVTRMAIPKLVKIYEEYG